MYLYENIYTRDFLKRIKYLKDNIKVESLISTCQKIDSIGNYSVYKNFIISNIKNYVKKKSKKRLFYLFKQEFGWEGLYYGYRKAFFDYAEIDNRKARFLFPCVEHGSDFRIRDKLLFRDPKRYENHSFVTQSSYKNKMLHKALPYTPVYNIGPYILYASSYYSSDKLKEIKAKNGRTALLFPGHTYEGSTITLSEDKFVDEVMSKFKKEYDTILVCVYWNDVDKPLYDKFETAGAKLVSAGFRGDQNFVRRLRSILEMSDVVASNMEGTYIGYAIALGKPFFMFSTRAKMYDKEWIGTDEQEKEFEDRINNMFYAFANLELTEEQKQMQHDFYTRFYGTPELFRTKEQARTIISLSEKLVKAGRATVKGIERVVKEIVSGKDAEKVAANIAGINSAEMEEFRKAMS